MVAEPPVLPNIAALRGLDRRLSNIEQRLRDLEVAPPPVAAPFPTPGISVPGLLARISAIEAQVALNRDTLDPATAAGSTFFSGIVDPRIDSRINAAVPGLLAAVDTELGSSTALRTTATTLIDGRINFSLIPTILPAVATEAARSGSPLRTAIEILSGAVSESRVGTVLTNAIADQRAGRGIGTAAGRSLRTFISDTVQVEVAKPTSPIGVSTRTAMLSFLSSELAKPTSPIRKALNTAVASITGPITTRINDLKATIGTTTDGLVKEWNDLVNEITGLRGQMTRPSVGTFTAALNSIVVGVGLLIQGSLTANTTVIQAGTARAQVGIANIATFHTTLDNWMNFQETIDDRIKDRAGGIRSRLQTLFGRL